MALFKSNLSIKRTSAIIAACLAAVGSAALVFRNQSSGSQIGNPLALLDKIKNNATGVCTSSNSDFVGTVNEFISEYKTNPVSFDQRFKGKCVSISGAPTDMSTTTGYSVTLSPYSRDFSTQPGPFQYNTDKSGMEILANFSKGDADELGDIRVNGSLVRLTGRVSGIIDNIYVSLDGSKLDRSYPDELQSIMSNERIQHRTNIKDAILGFSLVECTQNCTGPYLRGMTYYLGDGLEPRYLQMLQSLWKDVDPTVDCKIVKINVDGTFNTRMVTPDYGCGHDDAIDAIKGSYQVNRSSDGQLGAEVPFESLGRQ